MSTAAGFDLRQTDRLLTTTRSVRKRLDLTRAVERQVVIPCLLQRLPGNASVFETASLYGSIVPAVWSFMLALRSRGLGSAYTTLHLVNEREAGEILGIPETVTQVALIPVAYYAGDSFRPARRRPVEEIVYQNAWRQKLGV